MPPRNLGSLSQTALTPDPELSAVMNKLQRMRTSDLHLTSDAPPRVRIDGALKFLPGEPSWSAEKVARMVTSLLTENQQERFERELELDFSFSLEDGTRFRVNLYREKGHIGAAFRVFPANIRTLAQLGMPESIADFSLLRRGLVLVTGQTGSGKTTTLAALLQQINTTQTVHIMTVEDPIEFVHVADKALVNQREVGTDTHSFAAALRHVLRQDPDVILIGELRDLESMSTALTAAETGHLVFATLHTQDAPQTIDRIIDLFPAHQQPQVRLQLATTLKGIVSQILMPHAGGMGRVVGSEVLVVTPAVANLIREAKTFQIGSVMMAGREAGMHSMDQDLARLVASRTITLRVAYENAHDKAELMRLVGVAEEFVPSDIDRYVGSSNMGEESGGARS